MGDQVTREHRGMMETGVGVSDGNEGTGKQERSQKEMRKKVTGEQRRMMETGKERGIGAE
jgi:hypothetical protein